MHRKYLSDNQRMDIDTSKVHLVKFSIDSSDDEIILSGEAIEELITQLSTWADSNYYYRIHNGSE